MGNSRFYHTRERCLPGDPRNRPGPGL